MENEYIVISKTALLKKIEELEKANEVFRNSKTHNPTMAACEATLSTLKQILSQSTPLIPIVEDAFMSGSHFKEKYVKEIPLEDSNVVLKEPDFDKYISNLKINM